MKKLNTFSRFMFILLGLTLVLTMLSVRLTSKDVEAKKLKVVTTIFPQYDFAKNIGQNHIDLKMLVKPGVETHLYEPTPDDIAMIKNSDLLIYVGGKEDIWLDKMLNDMKDKPNTIKMIDLVNLLEEDHNESEHRNHSSDKHKDDDSHEDYDYDDHIWTSPRNAIAISEKITSELIKLDMDNREFYKENAKKYINTLFELDMEFISMVNNSNRKPLIFGDRFPFKYLTNNYKLEYYSALSSCSTKTDADINTIKFLIDKVKDNDIKVVFFTEFSNAKIADAIVEQTGAKKKLLHSCHNITKVEFEKGLGYIDLMKENLENLREALQ